jgi:hypothetical protein
MPQANVFRWRDGGGWLVLSGGGTWDSDDNASVEAAMLTHTHSQAPIAYIWAAGDVEAADRHMDALRELGARTGYLVDILTEDDQTLARQLSEAGVIILGDGPRRGVLRNALTGTALRSIEEAFDRGATLYAVGQAAAVLGADVVQDDGIVAGFNWLAQSLILPDYSGAQAARMHSWLIQHPGGYGLGLGQGAALAFGPRGELEVWGNAAAITISLGRDYQPGQGDSEGD